MRRPICMIGLAFVIVILLYRYFNPYSRTSYGVYDGSTVTVTGQVDKKEYRISNEQEVLVIYLKEVHLLESSKTNSTKTNVKEENLENNALNGKESITEITGVICYMQEKREPKMGSIVCIKGKFREFSAATNPGEFDAAAYYQILNLQGRLQNGILLQESSEYDRFREKLYEWKQYMAGLLELCFARKEASVMKAMLLGEKSQLDEDVKTLYQINGVIHILSISGLHISILGMGLYKILCKLRIPTAATVPLAVGFMYCYGVMTGMSVSSIRAIIMFGFHIGSKLCKRTYDMLTAMTIAAIFILIEQPLYLYHSGFLFSFGAILGIGLLAPAIEENRIGLPAPATKENRIGLPAPAIEGNRIGLPASAIEGNRIGLPAPAIEGNRIGLPASAAKEKEVGTRKIMKAIEANLAVSIAVFPVYLYFYYEYPVYSLFLNLLIIPGTALLVTGGLLSIAGAAFQIFLGKWMALPVGGLLCLYEICCTFFSKLPGNRRIIGQPAMWQIAIFVCLVCLTFICCKRMTKMEFWMYILLAFFCITMRFSDGLQITFLDVGQGDGIYLADGDGGHYLIDGGSSSKNELGEYQLVPFLKASGVDTLDAVFVTHLDEDHYNGIEYLLTQEEESGIRIKRLVLPELCENCQDEKYNALEKMALQQNVVLQYMGSGNVLQHGSLKLTCLHPDGCKNHIETTKKCEKEEITTNEQSLVLYLEYGNFTALFTGDLEGSGEEEVQKELEGLGLNQRRLTVLKVAHHGSRNSTSQAFLNLTRPEIAVISCGENNSYGHPHTELLERLEAVGAKVMRTDEMGAIKVLVKDSVRVTGYRMTN